jgi:hypothetical protein
MHVLIGQRSGIVRHHREARRRRAPPVSGGDKQVNGRLGEGSFILKSLETIQPRCRQARQGSTRACPEQCSSQELMIRQRARLSNDNSTDWFLPATGDYLPAELICGHELESHGSAEHAFVIRKHLV